MIRILLSLALLCGAISAQSTGKYGWACEGVSIELRGIPRANTTAVIAIRSSDGKRPDFFAAFLGRRAVHPLVRSCMLWAHPDFVFGLLPVQAGNEWVAIMPLPLTKPLVGLLLHWQGLRVRGPQLSSSGGLWIRVGPAK